MNSNNNYSPFVEHSFRRLTHLIHQQNLLNISGSISESKIAEHSSETSSLVKLDKNNASNNNMLSFSSKEECYKQRINDIPADLIEKNVNVESWIKSHRIFMRPPKTRTTALPRFSSLNSSNRSPASLNYTWNSPCGTSITQQESQELPIYIPYERTLYDIKFERDRQNDLRRKYDIPSPFQRKWLRQPRYIPQERPQFSQLEQQNQQ